MTEKELYNLKIKDSKDELLREINQIEKELDSNKEKTILIPYVTALIDKESDFTSSEIIDMLKDDSIEEVLKSALVKIYINNNFDINELIELLHNENISLNIKNHIVSLADLTLMQLSDIYCKFDGSFIVIAMKKMITLDNLYAYTLSKDIIFNRTRETSDDKLLSSCIAIGEYYNINNISIKNDDPILNELKELYLLSKNELLRDQAIYALGKMNNLDVFENILDNNTIDKELKITTIENNVDLIINKINKNYSNNDFILINKAMRIHPVLDVGEALEKNILKINTYNLSQTENEVLELIDFIEQNGVKGVNINE